MKIFWHLYVRNPILFIGQAITNWKVVGSIFPTSAPLRKAVIRAGIGTQKHFDLVIIHGFGAGEFVYEILRQAHKQNLSISKLIAMDVNPKFIANGLKLLPVITKRYPSRTQVTLESMDALDTPRYLTDKMLGKADTVIGAIPYSNLQQAELDSWAKMYASITNRFVYYTYLKGFKPPKHIIAANTFRKHLAEDFDKVSEPAKIMTNIPPAKVITAENI